MLPPKDPVRLLLAAYREADEVAAIHHNCTRLQGYPQVLCQGAASAAFRRYWRRVAP